MYLVRILLLVGIVSFSSAEQISCTGRLTRVGFLPQYGGKVIAIDTEYRSGIWAKTVTEDKTEMVMSLLLAGLMADKTMLIQYNTQGATKCTEIEQWTGAITVERVFVEK